ncbi:hypothetical protein VZ95_00290 [Elstera litoralis]|uniref:Uncharacterized protein n=1 Tax=Elstera litoralis TaxID=552518 RepID=A0A0F3IWM6_9PROT|nr:hypothetical protein [Elstera litoralis]KJV11140.1 hypothetical protein VZ95_00290 [Elstera litoralis]
MLTFIGNDGDRVLLLIVFVMLWLACACALEFGGLAQRTAGWTRARAILWGALALTIGIMVGQTLAALPALLGGQVPALNKLIFGIGGGAAIFAGAANAFYLMSRPGLTVACILKASLSLSVGQAITSLLVLYQLMPLQMIHLDWGLMVAGAMMALATTTGTFALTTTALGRLNRLFAAALLTIGLVGSRFLTIIGTSGLPLSEAVSKKRPHSRLQSRFARNARRGHDRRGDDYRRSGWVDGADARHSALARQPRPAARPPRAGSPAASA